MTAIEQLKQRYPNESQDIIEAALAVQIQEGARDLRDSVIDRLYRTSEEIPQLQAWRQEAAQFAGPLTADFVLHHSAAAFTWPELVSYLDTIIEQVQRYSVSM